MKTIYSLKEFHQDVCKICPDITPDHVSVRVEIGLYAEVKFHAYVSGYNLYDAKTVEECLDKVRAAISPMEIDKPNIDVELDAENTTVAEIPVDNSEPEILPF